MPTTGRGERPALLLIGGYDPSGGAGLLADQRAAAGADLVIRAVPTAITRQSDARVVKAGAMPASDVREMLDAAVEGSPPRGVKIGLLPDAAVADAVRRAAEEWSCPVVLDPVLAASAGGGRLTAPGTIPALRKILRRVTIVTPNLEEARALAGADQRTPPELLAQDLHHRGAPAVLVKGGHAPVAPETIDTLLVAQSPRKAGTVRGLPLPTLLAPGGGRRSARGTGCWLGTRIAVHLALGLPLEASVELAREELWDALGRTPHGGQIPAVPPLVAAAAGRGVDPGMLAEHALAVRRCVRLLPRPLVAEVGCNLGYVRSKARDIRDGLALAGRIVRGGGIGDGRPIAVGPLEWGGDHHTVRLALAAHARAPGIRAAMNLHAPPGLASAAQAAGLTVLGLERTAESAGPGHVRTMEWLLDEAVRRAGAVPDVIWDRGAAGKEAMARLFGAGPGEIVEKLRRILAAGPREWPEGD